MKKLPRTHFHLPFLILRICLLVLSSLILYSSIFYSSSHFSNFRFISYGIYNLFITSAEKQSHDIDAYHGTRFHFIFAYNKLLKCNDFGAHVLSIFYFFLAVCKLLTQSIPVKMLNEPKQIRIYTKIYIRAVK